MNGKGNEEVICAIGELAGVSTTTGIGAATITSVEFVTTSFDVSDGGNIDVRVIFNEKVTVDTTGYTIYCNHKLTGRWWFCSNIDCNLSVWFRTNRLRFRVTLGAAGTTVVADDVLSIAAQNIALNSGTLVDTGIDGTTVWTYDFWSGSICIWYTYSSCISNINGVNYGKE